MSVNWFLSLEDAKESIDILPVVFSTSLVIKARFSIVCPQEKDNFLLPVTHIFSLMVDVITTSSEVTELFIMQAIGLKTIKLDFKLPRRHTGMAIRSVTQPRGQREQRQPTWKLGMGRFSVGDN